MCWSGPLTHRQFLVWQAWLHNEWQNPDRHDYYLMQIAREIRGLFNKGVRTDSLKIPFIFKQQTPVAKSGKRTKKTSTGLTREQIVDFSKQIWLGRMTMPVTHKDKGK